MVCNKGSNINLSVPFKILICPLKLPNMSDEVSSGITSVCILVGADVDYLKIYDRFATTLACHSIINMCTFVEMLNSLISLLSIIFLFSVLFTCHLMLFDVFRLRQ